MPNDGRSWFYLTLWRGSPPEFASDFDVTINRSDSVFASIHTDDAVESGIRTAESLAADVSTIDAVGADIITVTEVVWIVH